MECDKPSVELVMPAIVNDNDGKNTGISNHIGKIPVIAVGNSDGDLPMLKWTDSGQNSLKVYIHHTDSKENGHMIKILLLGDWMGSYIR